MSKHVEPHRWADLMRGDVSPAESAAMERHATTCMRCDKARVRIQRVSDTFPVLRERGAPELGWDGVRARIHWSVSKAKRESGEHAPIKPRSWLPAFVAATTAVAAGSIGVYWYTHASTPSGAPTAVVAHAPEAKVARHPARLTALVSRLAGDVMIDGVRAEEPSTLFAKPLGVGTVLATGEGRVDVQFGESSAFGLGPRSTLEFRAFDAETIELVVDGAVDLEVAPRANNQRFLITAGDRTIEVRGTRFTVKHDAEGTLVSCQHGLVAVREAAVAGELEVATARKAFVPAHATVQPKAVPLTAEELTALATATPWSTPGWNADLAMHSAPLEISAPVGAPRRDMRVDGIELGVAPFVMRVMPGRHTVEATDFTGRFRRAGWVDVSARGPGSPTSHFDAPLEEPPASSTTAVTVRKQQLAAGIDHTRLQQCTRRLAKSGLTDTFVQIEITVDGAGAVNVLNIVDTDLPSDTAACVHDALADVHFAAGQPASWREKLTL